jgi:hypothetical protein
MTNAQAPADGPQPAALTKGYSLRTGPLGLVFKTGDKWGRVQYAGKILDVDGSNGEVYVYLDIGDDYGSATYRNYVSFAVWDEQNKRLRHGDAYMLIHPVNGGREAWITMVHD